MTKIGDGRPGSVQQPGTERAAEGSEKAKDTQGQQGAKKVYDSFVAGGVKTGLETLAARKPTTGPIQFSNGQLAQIAEQFAILLRKNPSADRKGRARMFAQCIIRGRKFGRIFDQADEKELEGLYDAIASQLDGVPVLAQLVDEVTDWTLRSPVQR
ncbi:MAG: hypothetical protein H7Z43_12840 [Clostridia bacterium]|nr:hypothetical protein [Deltaproteobacteria bacterium]